MSERQLRRKTSKTSKELIDEVKKQFETFNDLEEGKKRKRGENSEAFESDVQPCKTPATEDENNFTTPNFEQNYYLAEGETDTDEEDFLENDMYRFSSTESLDSNDSYTVNESYVFETADTQKGSEISSDLKTWAVDHSIKLNALSALLKLLQTHYPSSNLPSDARTLLGTPKTTEIFEIEGGSYIHFGLSATIINILAERIIFQNHSMDINFIVNCDGAPAGNSSEKNLWFILCSEHSSQSVFPIGIFHCEGKPKNCEEFLSRFIDEAVGLINNGIDWEDKHYNINFHALVCDVPAKSWILNVNSHTGYNSCTKCEIEGKYDGRVYFPFDENMKLRSDKKFKKFKYQNEYQQGESCLNRIPRFGLVSQVPLDYMHLVCLGVMKKLLLFWCKKPHYFKLSEEQKKFVSNALICFRTCLPSEFARHPRGLHTVANWKATEFRQFLLYLGPFVLKKVLKKETYDHFIALHVAITILCCPYYSNKIAYINHAEKLLKYFVEDFENIYESKYISHNVHNLLHLVDGVRRFGCLDNFSAFRFENSIFKLKNMLRKYDQPLQQISRRFTERLNVEREQNYVTRRKTDLFHKKHSSGPVPNNKCNAQYKRFNGKNFFIDVDDDKNNSVIINDTFVMVLNFVKIDNDVYVIGKELVPVGNIYSGTIDSIKLKECVVEIDNNMKLFRSADIKAKLCKIKFEDKLYVFPLFHTLCE